MPKVHIGTMTGADAQGDACLYFQVLNEYGIHQRYLTESEIDVVVARLNIPEQMSIEPTFACPECGAEKELDCICDDLNHAV